MADGGGSSMNEPNARNAANAAAFKALPTAGTPAYWARLEDTAASSRLDLEVLVMCARERLASGRLRDVARIYALLLHKTETKLARWANDLIPRGVSSRAQIVEELMEDCRIGLWRELESPDETFLILGFWTRMRRMMTNLAEQTRIAEGVRPRSGVVKPTRVPLSQLDRLDQPISSEDERTLEDTIADAAASQVYGLSETLTDLRAVASHLDDTERLLLWNDITGRYTQDQLGEILGITGRAVRDHLTKLHAKLRRLLNPDHPGDGAMAPDGGEEHDG